MDWDLENLNWKGIFRKILVTLYCESAHLYELFLGDLWCRSKARFYIGTFFLGAHLWTSPEVERIGIKFVNINWSLSRHPLSCTRQNQKLDPLPFYFLSILLLYLTSLFAPLEWFLAPIGCNFTRLNILLYRFAACSVIGLSFSSFAADSNPHPAIVWCEDVLGTNLRESLDVEFAKKDIESRWLIVCRLITCAAAGHICTNFRLRWGRFKILRNCARVCASGSFRTNIFWSLLILFPQSSCQ